MTSPEKPAAGEHGVELQRLDTEWVDYIRELMGKLPELPEEYVRQTETLIERGKSSGMTPEETADLEGRVTYLRSEVRSRKGAQHVEQHDTQHGEPTSRSERIKKAFSRARFRHTVRPEKEVGEPPVDYERPDFYERKRALRALKAEEQKVRDRTFTTQVERVRRMRTQDPAQKEEKRVRENNEEISKTERMRRLHILLRAGMYDRGRARRLMETHGDTVDVKMIRESGDGESIRVSKKELTDWFDSLLPHEKQRIYVIGRKKIDFKFNEKAFLEDYFKHYPRHRIEENDAAEEKSRKQKIIEAAIEGEKNFQKDQKELADALEVVALPMLRGVFKNLGKNVDVYLTSSNDDIAGGLDVAIDILKDDGTPELFSNGKPMRFVVDMTYARMRAKADKDFGRGRISAEAYGILQDRDKEMPSQLSNARAMKLFRTVVETLGSTMSTQTFDKNGPLKVPQEHVPRLIIGLDWEHAFSAIANWVESDDFEERYRKTGDARRIGLAIHNQMVGLRAAAFRHNKNNPNIRYLSELIGVLGFKTDRPSRRPSTDWSLTNIELLLTRGLFSRRKWIYNRFYHAALAQMEHDARAGGHVRGDITERKQDEGKGLSSLDTSGTRARPVPVTLPRTDTLERTAPPSQPSTPASSPEPDRSDKAIDPDELTNRRLDRLKMRALRADALAKKGEN